MHEFTVWAPKAQTVSVEVDGSRHAMEGPSEHGWWRTEVEAAGPGSDYAYWIDKEPQAYPDPRSFWQPQGVHAASRVYDQHTFKWEDKRWQGPPLSSAILYELHIGTFSAAGTFDGAIEHLDYLVELGITHIEIMPVHDFAGKMGWGYDGVALFAVNQAYGGPDGLKRLVNEAHKRGLAVLLDVVYNHFGPVGNYTNKFGPYLTDKHHTPWGNAVNFESEGSDEVRRFFIDNALLWLHDFHFDGLRLDAVHEFVDRSAIHFMEQLSAEVEVMETRLGRRLILIAESDLNDPKVVRPREAGGYGMTAQWSDDFHHSLFTLLHLDKGKGYYDDFGAFEDLAKSLKKMFVYDGVYSSYRLRSHGRPVDGLSAHHFICFIQNHDQVGNRATGDRLEHIVGLDLAKVAAGLVLTAPAVPMLFQGEEYAASTPFLYFADHEDAEMAKAVSEGRKREFAAFGFDEAEIPDPEKWETFESSKLKWSEIREGTHREMLGWMKSLIHVRRNSISLNDGDTGHIAVEYDEAQRWLVMKRGLVQVLANLGHGPHTFPVPAGFRLLLCSRANTEMKGGELSLEANTLALLSAEASFDEKD